jgi:hypothetical protein
LATCLAASLIIFFFTNLMVIRLIIIIIVVIEVVIIVILGLMVIRLTNFDIGWLIILRSHISSRPECPLNDYSRASHSVFNFRQPK